MGSPTGRGGGSTSDGHFVVSSEHEAVLIPSAGSQLEGAHLVAEPADQRSFIAEENESALNLKFVSGHYLSKNKKTVEAGSALIVQD